MSGRLFGYARVSVASDADDLSTQCRVLADCEQVFEGGKTHVALGLGLAACQRGFVLGLHHHRSTGHELMEARDERRLLNLQRQLSRLNLLIIDELGFVPLSRTGAELLFEVFSQRYERGSILVTTNLPFDE